MSKQVARRVGKRIKQLREGAQLTQSDLASLILKSVETISNFERGKTTPSLSTLDDLASHLGVGISAFFDEAPVKVDESPAERHIQNKARLLNDKDRELLVDIADLMIARAKKD